MYISHIKLTNWKNFQVCDLSLPLRVFVVGANATGKSNFLDAFRFMRDIVKQGGGLQSAVASRGGISKIRCLYARAHNNVRLEFTLADEENQTPLWNYELELRTTGGGIRKVQAAVVDELLTNLKTGTIVFNRRKEKPTEELAQLLYTYLEQPSVAVIPAEVREAFTSMEYLNVVPELVRSADSYVISSGKEDYFGRNFLKRMSVLNTATRNKYLRMIGGVLKIAVPQMEELTMVKDELGVPHIEAKYRHWRAAGARQNEQVFSDGTLRLIGFLFALLDGTGVILLEEPESNLHTGIVRQIPEFVSQMQRGKARQVIMTTHSYEILSNNGISSQEIVVLEPGSEGTKAYMGAQNEDIMRLLNAGFTVADAVIPITEPQQINKINQL